MTTIDLLVQFPELNPFELSGNFVFASSSVGWFIPDTAYAPRPLMGVYQSADGGATWRLRRLPIPSGRNAGAIVAVHPFSPTDVVVELTSGKDLDVVKSTDGGATWSDLRVAPLGTCGFSPCPIDFIDSEHWLAVGSFAVFRTANAGESWLAFAAPPPACCTLQFTDLLDGWVVGGVVLPDGEGANGLFRTTDGGIHWTEVKLPVLTTDLYPA